MNMKDLTVEEICRRINIQANLNDLQSKSIEKRNSALTTLVTITQLTERKDALYVLCGYYILEIKSLDDIELFLDAIRNLDSIELLKLILKDIAKDKNVFTAPQTSLGVFVGFMFEIRSES